MPPKPKPHVELRIEIERRGYTQEYLGRKIGRGETYVNQRLCGGKPWDEDDMYKIMDMFRLPYDQLHIYFPPRGIPKKQADTGKAQPRHYALPFAK